MDTSDRTLMRLRLKLEWEKARQDYINAGKPFGGGRGLEIWIGYDQGTTVN